MRVLGGVEQTVGCFGLLLVVVLGSMQILVMQNRHFKPFS